MRNVKCLSCMRKFPYFIEAAAWVFGEASSLNQHGKVKAGAFAKGKSNLQ